MESLRQLKSELGWEVLRRENQTPPDGDWRTWLILAGRGWGKTRTGAEWVNDNLNRYGRWHIVGPTAGDVRDVMVEGESGLLATARPNMRPKYEPSKRRLTWPNGTLASLFSADEPDRLRGPQCEALWADELAVWRYPEAWDMAQLGLRLGPDPRQIVTTTPKPNRLVRDLVKAPTTFVTRGSTFENRNNLAPAFFEHIVRQYEGTRLGQQELYALILDDVPGALWARHDIRYRPVIERETDSGREAALQRCAVAIDPAATSGEDADETGIIVAGVGIDGFGYVLEDLSGRYQPLEWARIAAEAYRRHRADSIVAEVNQGGEMVEAVLRTVDQAVAIRTVRASRGKITRAQPVASLYQQGRIYHVAPLADLEDQLCSYTGAVGERSPDRLDALVWALTDLMVDESEGPAFSAIV